MATNVTAPIPGKILAVEVEPGKQVKKGDLLITLEAMKMENYIEAPVDGVVKDVKVKPGDTVKAGDILVVIE